MQVMRARSECRNMISRLDRQLHSFDSKRQPGFWCRSLEQSSPPMPIRWWCRC